MDNLVEDIEESLRKLKMDPKSVYEIPRDADMEAYLAVLSDFERRVNNTPITPTTAVVSTNAQANANNNANNNTNTNIKDSSDRSPFEEYLSALDDLERRLDNILLEFMFDRPMTLIPTWPTTATASTTTTSMNMNAQADVNANTLANINTIIDNMPPSFYLYNRYSPTTLAPDLNRHYRYRRQHYNTRLWSLDVLRCQPYRIPDDTDTATAAAGEGEPRHTFICTPRIFCVHPLAISDLEASFQQATGTSRAETDKRAQFKAVLEEMLAQTRQFANCGVKWAREDVGPLEAALGAWNTMIFRAMMAPRRAQIQFGGGIRIGEGR
ncbi:hypothetical protein QBC45DRAFT_395683 [Copromyces sp. CBS 386.78]|nr:hypothetical protein QBC45DRAFT_395683 [Copromyces sp. CBS 386.78]